MQRAQSRGLALPRRGFTALTSVVRSVWQGPADLPAALETEWRLVAIRWLGIMLMTPSVGLLNLSTEQLLAAYGLLFGAAMYNAAIQAGLSQPQRRAVFASGYVTTLGDAALNIAMISLGGGFGTPLYYLLYTVTIASAMRHGYGPAVAVCLSFVGADALEHRMSGVGLEGPFLVRSGFLALTGLLASYLREQAQRAQAALQTQLERARYESLHDRLTGLPNRTLLSERIDQILGATKPEVSPLAVLFIDLDRFKEVNNTFGHRYGDLVLQETGRRLADELPESATLARLSGDEFAVVLPGMDAEAASLTAEALLRTLEEPLQLQEITVAVSASIGIAVAPEHGDNADDLQRRADIAMYAAKSRRGDCVVYSPDQDLHSRERLELAADLRRAIDKGELRLHYQPIVSLHSGRIEEVEALARWQHPVRGMVPPNQFIPLAEETGMILPIGRWVLEEACRQAVAWRSDYPAAQELVMSVNLSARQFHYTDVPGEISAVLQESGLQPEGLKIEITESIAMGDVELSIAALWLLKGMGVHLAIDDFGTGYSSLGYLKRIPADTLKIDKVFIDGLGVHAEDSAIVAATVAFAHAVGLTTTAEGVEHPEQLALIRAVGADRVQGYYCSKPLPADQFAELLASEWSLSAQPAEVLRAA